MHCELCPAYCDDRPDKATEVITTDKVVLQEQAKARTEKQYDNDVEYVRMDAFVEKACEWIKEKWDGNCTHPAVIDSVIEEFKSFMKANNKI